jgi:hypothetical protein
MSVVEGSEAARWCGHRGSVKPPKSEFSSSRRRSSGPLNLIHYDETELRPTPCPFCLAPENSCSGVRAGSDADQAYIPAGPCANNLSSINILRALRQN